MTTKFGVRPAPRKKPWICKRSPPCLVPDPIPASVMCTYNVHISSGPCGGQHHFGTYAVPNVPGSWTFRGTDPSPTSSFWIEWDYQPGDQTGQAYSMYGNPPFCDMGNWFTWPAGLPPNLKWASYHLEGSMYLASGFCIVTS